MKYKSLKFLLGVAVALMSPVVMADSQKDFATMSKAISFIKSGPSGDVVMDILFDPSNADSKAHADEVASIVAGGVGSGKVKLSGQKVSSVSNASSQVIFVTRGASGLYGAALDKAAANGGLTVSTDENCSGCVMVVKTEPSVDIFVNTAAASKTGTQFASAFSMMIIQK